MPREIRARVTTLLYPVLILVIVICIPVIKFANILWNSTKMFVHLRLARSQFNSFNQEQMVAVCTSMLRVDLAFICRYSLEIFTWDTAPRYFDQDDFIASVQLNRE